MSRPKGKVSKAKFGTTLPSELLPRVREYADREKMRLDQAFVGALELWMDALDGKNGHKPGHAAIHRRLEALLESEDPAVLEAVGGVLSVCERAVKSGLS